MGLAQVGNFYLNLNLILRKFKFVKRLCLERLCFVNLNCYLNLILILRKFKFVKRLCLEQLCFVNLNCYYLKEF